MPAPGGAWDATDNGTYALTLLEGAVEDTLNNTTPRSVLGSFNVAISTATPGVLAISPAGGLTSSGSVGGPFNPSSISYVLTNSGGSTLNWTASKTVDWLSLSATGGSLPAGTWTNVTISLNANANSLTTGSYNDTVSFVNTTTGNGNTSRSVSLTVNSAGQLAVTPAGDLSSSGTVGGPFSPSSINYVLTNSGGSTLNWTAHASRDWLSLSVSNGTLAPGASVTVTVLLNGAADALAAGSYTNTLNFANTSEGGDSVFRTGQLTVGSLPPAVLAGSWLDSGGYQLALIGPPLQAYVIEASTNLTDWNGLVTNTAGADGAVSYLDSKTAQTPARFYRARLLP